MSARFFGSHGAGMRKLKRGEISERRAIDLSPNRIQPARDQHWPCPMSFETSKMTNEINLPLRLYL